MISIHEKLEDANLIQSNSTTMEIRYHQCSLGSLGIYGQKRRRHGLESPTDEKPPGRISYE